MIRFGGLTCLAGLMLSLAALADNPPSRSKPDDHQQQRQKLVGLWKGFVVEGKGERADRGPVKVELTITETTIRGVEFKQGDGGGTVDHGVGDFTLDPTTDPPRLDAAQTRPNGQKARHLGIYALDGDTLKWCVTKRDARPETFATTKGNYLLILKRDPAK